MLIYTTSEENLSIVVAIISSCKMSLTYIQNFANLYFSYLIGRLVKVRGVIVSKASSMPLVNIDGRTTSEGQTDGHPFLLERPANRNMVEHVIDLTDAGNASTSVSQGDVHADMNELHHRDGPSTSTQAQAPPSSSSPPAASDSRNSFTTRRGENYGRRRRSPLNSGIWISIEVFVNVGQIVAAIVVLFLSKHEHPKAPLFSWVIGYAAGCIATLPYLYWRFIHRNGRGPNQEPASPRDGSSQNITLDTSYTAISISVTPTSDGDHSQTTAAPAQTGHRSPTAYTRLNVLVGHFKMGLDCFFAIWFVVGNVWVFGGDNSVADAPNIYRLCIVFLTFSCIGYAMPFILCGIICCCLPCIITIMGVREHSGKVRGATEESINSLPTYKFKMKRSLGRDENEIDSENHEVGILAVGTDKERFISTEDAVCCICLAKYEDGDELRELLCSHPFHKECVDQWLKINALCPLCKSEVGITAGSTSGADTDRP